MAINQPDLTGDNSGGSKGGVPGGTAPSGSSSALTVSTPASPQSMLQQRWRPPSLLEFHTMLVKAPAQVSRDLDTAIQRAYANTYALENQIACSQRGIATVTGSVKAIPTGLVTVKDCGGSIDNGATAHNFWVTVTASSTIGAIDVFVWQPTAAGNNTPIAATTAVKVRWYASGSLSTGT